MEPPAANPIRHEAHILKAFDIEGSQGRAVPAMARIQTQDQPDMGSCPVAGQLRGSNAVKG